ncbi:transaldolase [Aphanothece hegewaldii CCALA 016]|uniref:Transaldolase n=1 Tax=Aphanothece hegewaldii CCALA 016 TaxID=2107694 RepID=A0A2T1M2K7_9CHRO|nr:transaldolase [Aphanothece hegewaldii]PSF38988.1 transaldolase [Aphanothece hegewaldii CCALA 016]
MPNNLLDQLKKYTVVVADTGDLQAIQKFMPQDATTNPSLIATAAQMPEYREIVDETLLQAKKDAGSGATEKEVAALAFARLAVSFGKRILDIVPQRVSVQADPRFSYNTEATVRQSRFLLSEFEKAGTPRERVMIKIAATWEGVRAGEILEKEGIQANMTLLFGIHQAIACAEAGVTLISPYVGRITDWYTKNTGQQYEGADDPGVQSVTRIYNYYKKFDYPTEVMGASFRKISQITELAGCDLLTIGPKQLIQLQETTEELTRKLDPTKAATMDIEKMSIDQATFEKMHADNPMATEKLAEGIKGFSKALESLETFLANRLTQLESGAKVGVAATNIFAAYDFDEDGFITREEWLGLDAIFDALDLDSDGRITPDEMMAALGATFQMTAV